ncbi:MAG: transporter [Acidobacteriia bacterium]|nr:transporter [Terriglobia bacterium]
MNYFLKTRLSIRLFHYVLGMFVALAMNPRTPCQFIREQRDCYSQEMIANPNRPTVANPADITQYGVLELEQGWEHAWPAAGVHQTDFPTLLKFGLLCGLEIRWAPTAYLSQSNSAGTERGWGDTWLGPQFLFYKQTAHIPSLALSYAVKIPTANRDKGLGTGRFDHAVTLLASKDFGKTHVDVNATYFLIGRTPVGFLHDWQMNLSVAHPLRGPWGLTTEIYGNTRLDSNTPGFVSSLWALTYNVSPRLVLDGGIDVGLSRDAPNKRVFAGFTFSLINLYRFFGSRSNSPGP